MKNKNKTFHEEAIKAYDDGDYDQAASLLTFVKDELLIAQGHEDQRDTYEECIAHINAKNIKKLEW